MTDIEHVRRAFDEFNARFERLRDEDELRAYHAEFYNPDGVIDNVDHFPVPTSYAGFDGYRHWFDDALGPYEGMHFDVELLEPLGTQLIAVTTITGREPGDPTLIEVRVAILYTLRDGRISHVAVYLSEDAARAAADSAA